MKFFLDNNLSPALARALAALSVAELDVSQVVHLRDRFPRDVQDHVWIRDLAAEGEWVVISQDRFKKNDMEREALRRSGLIVFALDKQWSEWSHWPKAQNLIRWWPAIIEQAKRMQGGAAFRVAWRYTGRFQQIQM